MNRMRVAGSFLLALVLSTGCGGSSSSDSRSGGGGSGGGGATFLGLAILPGSSTLAVGGTLDLILVEEYSDGSQVPITGNWNSNNPGVASVDISTGLVTGQARGLAQITGTSNAHPGLSPKSNLRVFLTGIYAADRDVGLSVYPFAGGMPTTIPITPVGTTTFNLIELAGIAYHNGMIYWLRKGAQCIIYEIDPATGEMSEHILLPGPQTYTSLTVDSQGNIYVIMITGPDEIWKYDLSTGQFLASVLIGDGPYWSLDTDNNDNIYAHDINGTPWYVQKMAPNGTVNAVAGHPGGVAQFPSGGGLAITSDGGVMYTSDTLNNTIFRFEDLNQDGDYLDAGESQTVGSVVYPLGIWWHAADNSLLVNAGPGLRRLRDLNSDGDFLDAGEDTEFSSENINQGNTTSFLVRVDP